MASVNRLAIRGVRSFSPKDEEQVVEFFFPCTIIVGANGCGKTTIIESMKYAMTGSFPPGNKSGQAFVHDPRSIGSQVVKAQVKLRFTSRGGSSMVVIRSMEVTQKKTTLSFKQLDGALRTLDNQTGKIVSLSHKCSELDRQLPQLLGVSGPILEHVLFCHQEDASWPLQEGAVLKKRFDDIFDSTRYTKAIDVFRKTEKELLGTVKDLKADLAGLASHRHAAHSYQNELLRHQELLDQLDSNKKDMAQDIAQAEQAQEDAMTIIDQIENIQAEINIASNQHLAKLEMASKQKEMLERDLTHKYDTAEPLRKMLTDYHQQVQHQADELTQLQNRDTALKQELMQLQQQERNLAEQRTRHEAAQEQQTGRCQQRYAKMEHMAQTHSLDLQLTPSSQLIMALSQNTTNNTTFLDNFPEPSAAAHQPPELSITTEDMEQFFRVLEKKEQELQDSLQETKDRYQKEEDQLVAALSDLEARKKAVTNERQKISEQRENFMQEQKELLKQLDSGTGARIRKADIEDQRRTATKLAKERDEIMNDPRRTKIPTEIRGCEEKIDTIKRELDDDRIALDGLRHVAENQNAIRVLQEQCSKDLEALEDAFREQSFLLQKHNLKPNQDMPTDEDDPDGHLLVSFVEDILNRVRDRHDTLKNDSSLADDQVSKTQRTWNERSAILSTLQQQLNITRNRLELLESENGSVTQVRKLVDNLRRHEANLGLTPPPKEVAPQELLQYLNDRLSELEEDAPYDDAHAARSFLRKLTRMAQVPDSSVQGFRLVCPCCDRSMNQAETATFKVKMESLKQDSILVKTSNAEVENYNAMRGNYEKWRKAVNEKMDDLRDFRRLREEKAKLEIQVDEVDDEVSKHQATLAEQKEHSKSIQVELDDLQELLDACRRWSGDASRISEKRMQIDQKKQDMTLDTSSDGRDLRTVEREIAERMERKDNYMNQINRLNKEMTNLNNRITQISTQLSNVDKLVREKEEKFSAAQKKEERRTELVDLLNKLQDEDQKLQEQLAPLKRKIETKGREKDRARALKESEVSSCHNMLIEFQGEVKELRSLSKSIDEFLASEQTQGFESIESRIAEVLKQIEDKQQEQKVIQDDLSKLQEAVQDQERHKKMIRDNIDVIETQLAAKELEKEVERLKEQLSKIEKSDTAYEDSKKAEALKHKRQGELARIEGRWMEVVESIRSLKRKLSTEEYKDVDEKFRVTNIKFQTTQMAAEDLKKYWTAVDKALLKYHSVKIGEINKIVRELWLLTYKGEDISNIEIVSGEDPGSRSTRSYNYRVVMTKGNSQLDMRGRCSAGQRVLASIVIRLALAETFGVNCGCIALDEPTVNLDHPNKKGLAVALAQIIASRAQQSNFQLILITHDEEFVSMVKTEMSMMTGFSMPEKYFQVRRERASDGKFYSKIEERDWSELV